MGIRKASIAIWALALLSIAVTVTLSTPPPTHAAFPGADGRIAFSGDPNTYTILPDGTGLQQLTHENAPELGQSWSADGTRLVFTATLPRRRQIVTVAADGSDRQIVAEFGAPGPGDPGPFAPSFSPSGRRIVFSTKRAIRTIKTDGSDRTRVITVENPNESQLHNPKYSPDDKLILFNGQPKGEEKSGIYTVRPNGSHLRWVTGGGGADWSPDGRQIVFGDNGRVRIARADGTHRRALPSRAFALSFSPSGTRILGTLEHDPPFERECQEIVTFATDGSDVRSVAGDCDPASPGFFPGGAIAGGWQPLVDPS